MTKILTPVLARRLEAGSEILENPVEQIAYQHTVFCQTCLPYKNPREIRIWERQQGAVYLRIEAGAVRNPKERRFIDVGLPFGTRPRLILAHLNRQALLTGSARIEVESSLTSFVRRVCGLSSANSREILRFKEQLTRFAAASVRMAVDLRSDKAYQINTYVIKAMELWLTKNENQRVLWPAFVELSPDYFESLTRHAVPLDERAIAALSNSPMALDVYAWLAQRLCRIPDRKSQLVSWVNLHDQFGQEFGEIRFFRRNFLRVLKLVKSQYPTARFEAEARGVILAQSPPPVAPRVQVVCG